MLRLLLFVEPKPLPEHLFRNRYWLDFPLRIFRQLHRDSPDLFEMHVAVPRRFLDGVRSEQMFQHRIYSINEVAMANRIHSKGHTLRDVWISDFLGSTDSELQQMLDRIVCNSIPHDLDWDIVITFGEECRYSFASTAMKINFETSPFSRPPFRHSFFMDHCGLFRNAAPAKWFNLSREQPEFSASSQQVSLSNGIRQAAVEMLSHTERRLPFKRRYDRYLLLPLQASNYSSFDAQAMHLRISTNRAGGTSARDATHTQLDHDRGRYDSQIDFLLDVCSQVDSDIGILVTEHPNVPSIDTSNRFAHVLRGLHEMLPNLEYLPRAKSFSSGSFQLLPQVDWIWTIASNIGPVAKFLGKRVGSPGDSHIAFATDASDLDTLLATHPQTAEADIDPVFHWMFNHYVMPSHKIEEPEWLTQYLMARFRAVKEQGFNEIAAFVPTECDVDDFIERRPSTTTVSVAGLQAMETKIELFRFRTRQRLQNLYSKTGQQSYVLVNDTAELESYRHIGCNHVMATIYETLQQMGFRMLYRANAPTDMQPDRPAPDWVIINGEGTFHHDAARAKQLLEMALAYQSRGSKIALLNSIWESNAPELAGSLPSFDLIAVRDGASQRTLAEAGVNALLTPDFSLPQWQPLDRDSRRNRQGLLFTDSIVYERALRLFDASVHLEGTFCLLDHRQLAQYDQDGCFKTALQPLGSLDFLIHDSQIDRARVVVTGRFHVAMACIALGNIFLYIDSNTSKISNLCNDIGLPVELLNVTSLVDDCDWKELNGRIREVSTAFETLLPLIRDYRQQGMKRIADVFDQLKLNRS